MSRWYHPFSAVCPKCGCCLTVDANQQTVVNPTATTMTATYCDSERRPVVIELYDRDAAKAYGNSVVPQVVEAVWRAVMDATP